jgi:hypothetical protein
MKPRCLTLEERDEYVDRANAAVMKSLPYANEAFGIMEDARDRMLAIPYAIDAGETADVTAAITCARALLLKAGKLFKAAATASEPCAYLDTAVAGWEPS